MSMRMEPLHPVSAISMVPSISALDEPWKNPFEFLEKILRWRNERHPPIRVPSVTLFFDVVKHMTVAVLAHAADTGLSEYFASRVHEGSAYQVSPLYYELEGYIRENLFQFRAHRPNNTVTIAMGSLDDSDSAQRTILQCPRRQGPAPDPEILETVLEIARLNRFADDLDVLSIHFMRQVNTVFARVADRMAEQRLTNITISVTPYVDGVSLSGFSKFVRRDGAPLNTLDIVRHSESGRLVEYQKCSPIKFHAIESHDSSYQRYQPCHDVVFSWKCEEVILANLHRWWGDIALPEYVGQKVVVHWNPEKGPDVELTKGPNSSLALVALQLPVAMGLMEGVREWSLSQARMILDVQKCKPVRLDDVATSYSGRMQVQEVHLHFACAVRAAARAKAAQMRKEYMMIQDHRPLLEEEENYLRWVEGATLLK